jgi:hypothetical protein
MAKGILIINYVKNVCINSRREDPLQLKITGGCPVCHPAIN